MNNFSYQQIIAQFSFFQIKPCLFPSSSVKKKLAIVVGCLFLSFPAYADKGLNSLSVVFRYIQGEDKFVTEYNRTITDLKPSIHSIIRRVSHPYTRGVSVGGEKICKEHNYETGYLVLIDKISSDDVSIKAKITVVEDIDKGVKTIGTYSCGDIEDYISTRNVKVIETTITKNLPKVLLVDEHTKIGLLLK
jgi:hypothetical protein